MSDAEGTATAPAHEVPVREATVREAVTALFVPGNRPDRFGKAMQAGADVVIVDLEDAVDPGDRSSALADTVAALRADSIRALVRIGGADAVDEIDALVGAGGSSALLGVVIPKADAPESVREIVRRLPSGSEVVALVESAAGVAAALDIARVPGVTRLAFGAVDFALDVDADDEAVFGYARSALVVASRAAGIAPPLDSPSLEIERLGAVRVAARGARRMGFGGKLCVHPSQVEVVRDAFRPTDEELDWARSIVAAEGNASQHHGLMVDRPVVEKAKRILARSAGQR